MASLSGATEPPSPVISVVIPWKIFDGRRGSTRMVSSDCPSMSMNPGATTMPCGVDRPLGRRLAEVADRRDPPVADADVPRIPGRAGAVDDVAVRENEVEGEVRRAEPGGEDEEQEGEANEISEFHEDLFYP